MISSSGSSGSCREVVVVTTGVTVINKVQILINLTTVQETIVVAVRDSASFDRVEQEPGSGFVFVIHVSSIVVVGDVDFDVGVVAGSDGEDRDAVVAACERVGGVDVGVAGGAEGGGVGLAEERRRCPLAGLADPHAFVPRGGGRVVNATVAGGAEVGVVGAAEDGGGGGAARIARARPRASSFSLQHLGS